MTISFLNPMHFPVPQKSVNIAKNPIIPKIKDIPKRHAISQLDTQLPPMDPNLSCVRQFKYLVGNKTVINDNIVFPYHRKKCRDIVRVYDSNDVKPIITDISPDATNLYKILKKIGFLTKQHLPRQNLGYMIKNVAGLETITFHSKMLEHFQSFELMTKTYKIMGLSLEDLVFGDYLTLIGDKVVIKMPINVVKTKLSQITLHLHFKRKYNNINKLIKLNYAKIMPINETVTMFNHIENIDDFTDIYIFSLGTHKLLIRGKGQCIVTNQETGNQHVFNVNNQQTETVFNGSLGRVLKFTVTGNMTIRVVRRNIIKQIAGSIGFLYYYSYDYLTNFSNSYILKNPTQGQAVLPVSNTILTAKPAVYTKLITKRQQRIIKQTYNVTDEQLKRYKYIFQPSKLNGNIVVKTDKGCYQYEWSPVSRSFTSFARQHGNICSVKTKQTITNSTSTQTLEIDYLNNKVETTTVEKVNVDDDDDAQPAVKTEEIVVAKEEGMVAWKGCYNNTLVKLWIKSGTRMTRYETSGKNRCASAKVLAIYQLDNGNVIGELQETQSLYDRNFIYRVGEIVTPTNGTYQNDNNHCGIGIHFYSRPSLAANYIGDSIADNKFIDSR